MASFILSYVVLMVNHFQLAEIIGKYGDNPDDFKKAGKEYTVSQISRLLSEGVDGIHVFALNKYDDVADIVVTSGLREQP